MIQWLNDLANVRARGQCAVSIAVASTKGSVPREAGTRMLVTPAEVVGTIGGGHLEFKSIQIAREILASAGASTLIRFPLGASLGQCCGGLVNLLFEPVAPDAGWVDALLLFQQQGKRCIAVTQARGTGSAGKLLVAGNERIGSLGGESLDREAAAIAMQRLAVSPFSTLLSLAGEEYFFEFIPTIDFNIAIFGAGHVGRAMVKILAELPCGITWVDSREKEFPSEIPSSVEKRVSDLPEDEVAGMPAGSYFLVMTHSHQLDLAICERILSRKDFDYFGLIGSLSKRRQFTRRLIAYGIPAARVDEMVCPIGVDGIATKEPMAIAVSVVTEMLRQRAALQRAQRNAYDVSLVSLGIAKRSPGHFLPAGSSDFAGR